MSLILDSTSQIVHNVTEKDEDEMLVTLDAQGFVGLVHYTKQVSSIIATLHSYLVHVQYSLSS